LLSRTAWCACVSFDEDRPRFSLDWGFAHPLTLRGPCPLSSWELTITHNFRELRERPKGQVVDNKKGAADNKL
jgi:hypothetical protein